MYFPLLEGKALHHFSKGRAHGPRSLVKHKVNTVQLFLAILCYFTEM